MYILYSLRIKLQLNINLVWFFVLTFTGLLNYFPLLAVVSPLLCLSLVLSKLSRDWIWNTTFLNNQIMSSRFLLGVSNGPIQFESARKMWPLLELLAKIMHLSMLSPRVGRGGYPREFDSESLPLSRDFDISRCPGIGNLTCPPSWKTERTWK